MPSVSALEHDQTPRQTRRGQLIRWALVIGAVAQLVAAIVLAVGPETDPARHQVTVVAPADAVSGVPETTTTTLPPVVVETPAVTEAPPAPVVAPGAVFGVIGAGAGGKARADLVDEAGNTWHSEADSRGGYRFDRLPPGQYQLILSAENDTGTAMSKRIIEIRSGEELREDYPVYGPTGPPAPTTTTAPSTTTTAAPLPSTTTSTTTTAR